MDAKLVAIVVIAALEGVALYQGMDGAALGAATAAIGGIAGYGAGRRKK